MNGDSSSRPSFGEWLSEPQTLIGLSAVLLSLCGLFVSLYETSLMREEQRAAVWPYVEVGVSLNSDDIGVFVQNKGVGPARVRAAALTYDDEVIRGWVELAERLLEDSLGRVPEEPQVGIYRSVFGGRVLGVEADREEIFQIGKSGPDDDVTDHERIVLNRFFQNTLNGRIDVRVCYCSVYDDCWTSSMQSVVRRVREQSGTEPPEPVETCDAAPQSGI